MRSAVRRDRTAGKRSTGTLTSPKVNVPLQNARGPGAASGSAAMARLLAPRLQARLQARDERVLAFGFRRFREADDFASGLGGEQTLELNFILIAELGRVEPVLERADELFRERDLAFVRRAVWARRHLTDLDDL